MYSIQGIQMLIAAQKQKAYCYWFVLEGGIVGYKC